MNINGNFVFTLISLNFLLNVKRAFTFPYISYKSLLNKKGSFSILINVEKMGLVGRDMVNRF